jgi:hypothetical protein
MTKTRTILLSLLALILVAGVCVPQAMAAGPQIHAFTIARSQMPQALPAAIPGVMQGMTGLGPNPPVASPVSWPCFAPNAPCTADPAGGMLVATPESIFSLTACQNTSGSNAGCGELWWTFEMGGATGNIIAAVTATQVSGMTTNTIFSIPPTNLGPAPPAGYIEVIYVTNLGFGPNFCSGCVAPVAGAATVAVTSAIKGTSTVAAKGGVKVLLH